MIVYIDGHKDRFGVEPICRVLTGHGCTIAPSTYYARKTRPLSARAIQDARKSLAYLEKEVDAARVVEIKETLYKLIESQYKTMLFSNVNDDYAFKVVDPALVPDEDDYVQPKRAVFAAVGCLLGLIVASLVLLFDLRRLADR